MCSGAIAAGLPALGLHDAPDRHRHAAGDRRGRPAAASWSASARSSAAHGLVAGQVLLTPYDFVHRTQYLHARETLRRLLDLGVLPVVNENDTVADDEIRYGDNDRLAALVVAPASAPTCSCCSPTPPGCSPPIPRLDDEASLIEEIVEVDAALEAVAGGAGTERGSGGMASKLAAAKIAAWSGVRAVIAAADAPDVVARRASPGEPVGTVVRARGASGSRAASSGSRSPAARPAGSSSTTAPAARSSSSGRSLLAGRACATSRASSTPTTRSRSSTTTGAPFAKGLVALLRRGAAAGRRPPHRRAPRRAARTRSSTATTSSSCPSDRPLTGTFRATCRLRERAVPAGHTLASRARRRPAGGESFARASTVGEEREEGEAGSPRP